MAMEAGTAVEDHGRTALVTGGTGGMGRAIAGKLAADGFDVAVAYAGDRKRLTRRSRRLPGIPVAAWPQNERHGGSDDIAGVVAFLAGPGGRWVNRQVVYANGGFV
jgi:NAD(P)-dependent dehydrogenase (short-subunit alcohol dehydrogenase family)